MITATEHHTHAAAVKVRECMVLAGQNPAGADFYLRLAANTWTRHLLDEVLANTRALALVMHVQITGLGFRQTSPQTTALEEWVDRLAIVGTSTAVREVADRLGAEV